MRTNTGRVNGIKTPKTKNAKKIKIFINYCVREPLRILVKARDFYVKSMLDCAGKATSYGIVYPVSGTLHFPMTNMYSPEAAVAEKGDVEEIYKELIRASASASSSCSSRGGVSEIILGEQKVVRSYGVRVGRLGRIDEDTICEFVEEGDEQDSFRSFRIFGF